MAKKKSKKAPSKTGEQKPAPKKAAKKALPPAIAVGRVHPPRGETVERLESFLVSFNRPINGLRPGHFRLTGTSETVARVVPSLALGGTQFKREFEIVLSGTLTGTATIRVTVDGTPTGGSPAPPQASNGDEFTADDTWTYNVEAENTAERVRLLVPPELHAHVQAMEQRDPGLIRSIVRSIFGSHDRSHFGVRRIVIELDTSATDKADKSKTPARPWDKSCL